MLVELPVLNLLDRGVSVGTTRNEDGQFTSSGFPFDVPYPLFLPPSILSVPLARCPIFVSSPHCPTTKTDKAVDAVDYSAYRRKGSVARRGFCEMAAAYDRVKPSVDGLRSLSWWKDRISVYIA